MNDQSLLVAENENNWRHTAWVWDETSDDISVYMDGQRERESFIDNLLVQNH